MPSRRSLLLAAGLAPLPAAFARAADWPTRPVRLIVPFAPGGSVDITARLLAQALRAPLGQEVVVENRTGGGGTLGAAAVAAAPADGYTILWANSAVMTAAPILMPSLPYRPSQDLRPVSLAMRTWHVVLGSPKRPYRHLAELLAAARAKPGALNFGSGGTGSAVHIVAERILAEAGISMVHIPYRGSAQAMTDLTTGRLDMLVETLASGMQQVRAGQAVALAVSSPEHIASAPEVPTVAESGVPGFTSSAWFGLVAPAAVPEAVVERLNNAVREALAGEGLKHRLTELGTDAIASGPAEFAAFMAKETEMTRQVVQRTGIRLD
jgi:tripartite-type tricarboxylate transporter receptor subunit TctC